MMAGSCAAEQIQNAGLCIATDAYFLICSVATGHTCACCAIPAAISLKDRFASIFQEPHMSRTPLFSLPAPRCFRLEAGQSLVEWVAAGTVLHLIDGDIEVAAPPVWLADTMWRSVQRLGRGSVYQVQTRGWLTVAASGGATLRVQPAVPAGIGVIAACASGLRRIAWVLANRAEKTDAAGTSTPIGTQRPTDRPRATAVCPCRDARAAPAPRSTLSETPADTPAGN